MNKSAAVNLVRVLELIADDMESDAANFDGQPFTGKTVAEYFGNQGAAIASLANIIKAHLLESAEMKGYDRGRLDGHAAQHAKDFEEGTR